MPRNYHFASDPLSQVEHHQFAVRFKNADIAKEFKSHVDRVSDEAALDSNAASIETPPSSPLPQLQQQQVQSDVVSSSSSTECLVVDEVLPEEDLVALAEKYQLPKSFYNYLKKAPCPGCIGCEDENPVVVSSTTEDKGETVGDVVEEKENAHSSEEKGTGTG